MSFLKNPRIQKTSAVTAPLRLWCTHNDDGLLTVAIEFRRPLEFQNVNMQLEMQQEKGKLTSATFSCSTIPRGRKHRHVASKSPKLCLLRCLNCFPVSGESDLPDDRLEFADNWRAVVDVLHSI
jgi:hypothetical protein